MDLDILCAYDRVGIHGPMECEVLAVRAALDARTAVVEKLYVKETRATVEVNDGRLTSKISFGTANPVPIEMKHVVSSTDHKLHVGFLTEYPHSKYRQYNNQWFMLIVLE